MKNLLLILVILLCCSKNKTDKFNDYQISIRYLGNQDAPHPKIILTNGKPTENIFPLSKYQIDKEDLIKIEKISFSETKEYNGNQLVLIEVNKDKQIEKYFLKKKKGIEVLMEIQRIVSHYHNHFLIGDLIDLQMATKQNWYRDGKVIGL